MQRSLPRPLLFLLPLVAALLPGEARSDVSDALIQVTDSDPMELARIARDHGDDAILGLLVGETERGIALAAIRATPSLEEPALALTALASHASGRDPDLAPAAVVAAHEIAIGLDASGPSRSELEPAALGPALVGLRSLADEATARADLRHLAALAADA
ncbi:MAG: hypothetical protein OEY14_11915, partial [Myxococcales bacterium]|nr:hypothetical protein [Myxococcales bacterium]